jgi:hypothetical protein
MITNNFAGQSIWVQFVILSGLFDLGKGELGETKFIRQTKSRRL